MTQVEYLLSKFPNYNDEAYGADIDNAISCTTSRPAGPVVFFKNPPSAMAGITIEGIEYFQGTEECNFTITIDDYDDGGNHDLRHKKSSNFRNLDRSSFRRRKKI